MSQLYAGRIFDYAILPNLPASPAMALVATDGQGRVVAGILKLAQRFLITLLTRTGALLYLPNYGSSFMLDGAMGAWRTVADVLQSFNLALPDVAQQLQLIETTTDPADECYGSATLLQVDLSTQPITLTVSIVSAAGNQFTLLVPITTIP